MRDIELLKTDPKALFDKLMGMLLAGEQLDETQLIMLETVRKILGVSNTNGI